MQMSVNVQVRFPSQITRMIDEEVRRGYFSSRSDAIRTIVQMYEFHKERKKFFSMLEKRAKNIEAGKFITLEQLEDEFK